jgi:hypothetical protein
MDQLTAQLTLPTEVGVYKITLRVSNTSGLESIEELNVLAVIDHSQISPLVYLPLDGNTSDYSGNEYEVLAKGNVLSYFDDVDGAEARSVGIFKAGDELQVTNTETLNFAEAISVSCWVSFSDFSAERFLLSHGS